VFENELILIDEVLTPDSSRFWPADQYQPGRGQPSFDKQFVRDYLETLDWDKSPPAPTLPPDVVARTESKYLDAYERLTGKKLTIEVVESLLREILHEEGRLTISIEVIQKKVAEHFDIRLADMTSKRRPENIAFPRQIAMYLSRQMTESSLSNIGEAFGGRDHGTVLHACRLVKDRMEVDANVRQVVHYLEKQLMR